MEMNEIAKKVQEYEAKIQSATGEKNALQRQESELQAELKKISQECKKQFDCSLTELENLKLKLESEINNLYKDLTEKVELLEQ